MFEDERADLAAATRERLAQYVDNRRKAYEAFAALDPDANYTKDAKRLYDKALRDQADYEAGSGPAGQ